MWTSIVVMYFIVMLTQISFALKVGAWITFGIFAVLSVGVAISGGEIIDKRDDFGATVNKWYKRVMYSTIALWVAYSIVPDTNKAIYIASGTVILEAAKSEQAKSISLKLVKTIEQLIDENLTKDPTEAPAK